MPTSSTSGSLEVEASTSRSSSSFLCCCNVADVVHEVRQQAAALNKHPPLALHPGHANEEGDARGMAAPKWGCLEVVNKNKEAEIIAVVAAVNASELCADGRDPAGHLPLALRQGCMPEQTVVHGSIDEEITTLQIALYYGSKYRAIEKAAAGRIQENFEFLKIYQVRCRAKNVLLKYKAGALELQQGQAHGMLGVGKRRSVGGGIDMKTNVESLELLQSLTL
jgi:hypothetical protein